MKKHFLLLLFTLITPIALCQYIDVEKRTRDAIYRNLNSYHDTLCDTLLLEDGNMFFFRMTPFVFFDGYSKLFSNDEGGSVNIMFNGSKGFTCKWIIKNNELYLKDYTFVGGYFTMVKDKKGKLVEKTVVLPGKMEQRKRIESLTNRKFNEEGLLKADWMSGAFGILKLQPFNQPYSESFLSRLDSLLKYQEELIISFNEGKVNTFFTKCPD
ncbi:MAG: hypothetical protein WCS06_03920 [Dysgonamonadaceae bacterium]